MSRIRVLVSKLGLDSHDRGALVVVNALKNAGMEVIYTGFKQSAESIVVTAIQEDVDVIGVSTLNNSHMFLIPDIVELMKEKGADDKLLIAGGIIPDEDIGKLAEIGVKACFGPGTDPANIARFIRENVAGRD